MALLKTIDIIVYLILLFLAAVCIYLFMCLLTVYVLTQIVNNIIGFLFILGSVFLALLLWLKYLMYRYGIKGE